MFLDLLAAATPAPQPVDDSKVTPGLIGLAFLVVMGAAVVVLWRSMNARLRNIDVDRHRRQQDAKGGAPGQATRVPTEDDGAETGAP
ncbi:MAG TPA: hypothetical protein VMZ00_07015 [Sporichthya sp.]|nr:hypothetical protein [Sporichthya sp.]